MKFKDRYPDKQHDFLPTSSFIRGWGELIEACNLSDETIKRLIAHYEFPRPIKVRTGKTLKNYWSKQTVELWFETYKIQTVRQRRIEVVKI